ncbi:hypothetical protein BDZ89DRAFT_1077010 [Hymenopellis radicata]|nr:hypothetical protein BDZ89DRAFT_1077010 [Hymenopellis radicata]
MGKSKNLKSALASQQTRLKHKEKSEKAAKATESQAKAKKLSQSRKSKQHLRPTIPFLPTDTILLIGEGNFSFTRALVRNPPPELTHLPPGNITATAYDSEQDCCSKYPDAQEILVDLRARGVQVLFGVDASKLDRVPQLKGRRWDKICWNFPHAGKGITDMDRNILSNQVLILDFLRTAEGLLKKGPIPSVGGHKKKKKKAEDDDDADEEEDNEDLRSMSGARGSILITLRNVTPYTLWDIPRLAKHPPAPIAGSTPPNSSYILLRSFVFHRSFWEGYEHRMTKGERAHGTGKTGEGGEDRTWEFCINNRA